MQRRAARFVKNEYSTTPGTVAKILNYLKWPKSSTTHNDVYSQFCGLSALQFYPIYYLKGDRAL